MPFYALHIPPKGASNVISNASSVNDPSLPNYNSTDSTLVFREKSKALEVLKQYKEARLKEFPNEDDAVEYAQSGYEIVNSRYNDVKSSTASVEKAAFRAPIKQELAAFRKCIEGGDYDRVRVTIWENPRYLVSSGDTPTSLKEGCRFNAMHICALSKRTQIAELILKTVSNTEFADLMIGKKNDHKSSKELATNLLDYYLNMPEKGRSETPLHLASKIGCVDMVELLTSYPECKMSANKDGHFPKDIICTRAPIGGSPEIFQKIKSLLEERFYVPVLRSMDGAVPPQIGQPFSPNNPPNLNTDPLSPEIKIQALAGPMNKDQAMKFCRRWKTPPRIGTSTSSAIASSPFISPIKARVNKSLQDSPGKPRSLFVDSPTMRRRSLFDSPMAKKCQEDNGVDDLLCHSENSLKENRNNKSLNDLSPRDSNPEEEDKTNNNQIELPKLDEQETKETAFFPSTPIMIKPRPMFLQYRDQNFDSPITSDLLQGNVSISEKEYFDSPGYQERHIKITNTEKGLEMIGRQLAKEQNVDWREYWDFLNTFVDITSQDGLQKLENHFAQQKNETELKKKSTELAFNSVVVLDDVCTALEKFGFNKDVKRNGFTDNRFDDLPPPTLQQSTTPYTCIEKSLQVFAKRITKTITINVENVTSINDILLSELKRLKSLICSFKEDMRFLNVDFTKVHSRIANLVSYYLNRSQEVNFSVKIKIQQILENLGNLPGERREHIECVCAKIIAFFEQPTSVEELPENIKNEEMCASTWHEELSCNCIWESNLSRKTSRRQRMETRLKQMKEAENQKRLIMESKGESKGNFDQFRSKSTGNDSSDDDVYWSECDASESDDDDDFYTPLQSPSRLSLLEEKEVEDPYKLFIYGDEPTKRDLDVINAIFNVDIDESKYPYIHAWKTAMSRFPTEVMDQFPSPAIIRKFPSFKLKSPTLVVSKKEQPRTPYHHRQFVVPNSATSTPIDSPLHNVKNLFENNINKNMQTMQTSTTSEQLPLAKRLFMSPLRKTPEPKKLFTPINKIKGIFTQYRDNPDNSPISSSFIASNSDTDRDNSMKLPVSSAE